MDPSGQGYPARGNVDHMVRAALRRLCMKHFLADFVLQRDWMVSGKEQPRGWAGALAAHAGCNALLTLLLVLVIAPRLRWISLVVFSFTAGSIVQRPGHHSA